MSDIEMWRMASSCYEEAHDYADAARCAEHAGEHRRAADLYIRAGRYHDAAASHTAIGGYAEAGWLLAHHGHDPAAARAVLSAAPAVDSIADLQVRAAETLLRRLAAARCDLIDENSTTAATHILTEVQDALATGAVSRSQQVEDRAVTLAETMHRYDQVALVFAAAVRAGRPGAATRWRQWAQKTLGTDIILPTVVTR
ncbi:hypothetical protein [Catellatospora coxensis]|nr:hypothetical protein [Catellatospora coxensis]